MEALATWTAVAQLPTIINVSGAVVCPMHMFRTGPDIRPTYGSLLMGLHSVRAYNENGLTGPGCWAHADMLALGVSVPQPPGAKHHCATASNPCSLNFTEMRTNFGSWCIISNPLILSMDLRDNAMLELVWPIITNREAIEVNQQWYGDSGRLHNQSSDTVVLPNCGTGSPCKSSRWMVWTKALPPATSVQGSRAAVLFMNNGGTAINISSSLAGIHGLGSCGNSGCAVRNVWTRSDDPLAMTVLRVRLEPHDSAFVVVSSPSLPSKTLNTQQIFV